MELKDAQKECIRCSDSRALIPGADDIRGLVMTLYVCNRLFFLLNKYLLLFISHYVACSGNRNGKGS